MALDDTSSQHSAVLLAQAAQGDARAAQDLAAMLGPRLFAQAFRLLGDRAEAEDVAQEALLRLWRRAPNWDASGSATVQTWCFAVVRNLCIDRMRRSTGTRAPVELDDSNTPSDPTPGVEAKLQNAARAEALQTALHALPDRQRQAVVLRHIEGLPNPEIAAQLEISVDAVESLIARGKRALASALAGRQDELGFYDDQT